MDDKQHSHEIVDRWMAYLGRQGKSPLTREAYINALNHFISWMRRLLSLVDAIMPGFLDDCWQACREAEMIIYSPFGWGGYHIAQKLNIPSYMASLQPMSRSRYFPAVWSPGWLKLGGCGNSLSYIAVEQVFWQVFRKSANRWRKEVLDLAPIPFGGPFGKPDWQRQSFQISTVGPQTKICKHSHIQKIKPTAL